jgi:hypothetical protein
VPSFRMLLVVGCATCNPYAASAFAQVARSGPVIILSTIEGAKGDFSNPAKAGLTRGDLRRITQSVPGKAMVVPIRRFQNTVRQGEQERMVTLVGTTDEFAKLFPVKITQGRFLAPIDLSEHNNLAVIDSGTAKALFPDGDPIDRTFLIGTQAFVVAGVWEHVEAMRVGPKIYIPLSTMRSRFGDMNILRGAGTFNVINYELSEIHIGLTDAMHVTAVAKLVQELLSASHESKDYAIEVLK